MSAGNTQGTGFLAIHLVGHHGVLPRFGFGSLAVAWLAAAGAGVWGRKP